MGYNDSVIESMKLALATLISIENGNLSTAIFKANKSLTFVFRDYGCALRAQKIINKMKSSLISPMFNLVGNEIEIYNIKNPTADHYYIKLDTVSEKDYRYKLATAIKTNKIKIPKKSIFRSISLLSPFGYRTYNKNFPFSQSKGFKLDYQHIFNDKTLVLTQLLEKTYSIYSYSDIKYKIIDSHQFIVRCDDDIILNNIIPIYYDTVNSMQNNFVNSYLIKTSLKGNKFYVIFKNQTNQQLLDSFTV